MGIIEFQRARAGLPHLPNLAKLRAYFSASGVMRHMVWRLAMPGKPATRLQNSEADLCAVSLFGCTCWTMPISSMLSAVMGPCDMVRCVATDGPTRSGRHSGGPHIGAMKT